jgi:hypothetical protein
MSQTRKNTIAPDARILVHIKEAPALFSFSFQGGLGKDCNHSQE